MTPRLLLCGLLGLASITPLPPLTATAHAQEDTGTLDGIVFVQGTGAPLVGATVTVGPHETTTGEDGRFTLALPPGTYAVAVTAAGHDPLPTSDIVIQAGQRSEILVTWQVDATVLPAQIEAPEAAATVAPTETDEAVLPLEGTIVSSETGEPVAGARIYVRGQRAEAATGPKGSFTLMLPEGTWTLSVVASTFAAQTVADVAVSPSSDPLVIELVPAGLALDDFTVRAPRIEGNAAGLLDERRKSSAVADVIGAEQMTRSGDSSAAGALRRVTGLTLVGGRYIYVRGLGERYSTTLLNGGQLPSPEPERRVVPLDMFPASVLDSVVVQKTFSPDMPAEFGGGVVQLRTRSIPSGPTLKVSLSTGARGHATFQQGLVYEGGPTDFLGIDGGTRTLPPEIREAAETSPLKEGDRFSEFGYTAEELETFGKSLNNVWTPTTRILPPNWSLSIGGGNRWEVAGRPIGMLAAVSYGDSWRSVDFNRTFFQIDRGEILPGNSYDFDVTTRRIRLSGLLTLSAQPAEGHDIQATTLVLRNTEDETMRYGGFFREESFDIDIGRLRWVERMLIGQQLIGEHKLAPGELATTLDWRYGYALATRIEPDRRLFRRDFETSIDDFILSRRDGDSNQRFYSDLDDQTHDVALNVTKPLAIRGDATAKLRFGTAFVRKDREVDSRRLTFINRGSTDAEYLNQPLEDLFAPDNINADGFQLKEVTQTTDNYFGEQTLIAGYAMAEVPVTPWFDLMAGARVEHSSQVVTTFELFNPNGDLSEARLTNTDVLPALTTTFRPIEPLQIRAGYGRTLSRPEFRELSDAIFQPVIGGRQEFGNPDLVRATIENVDLRVEWFPEAGDVISASFFYKFFRRPIESVVTVGAEEQLTYANALSANNYGVEIELRKGLGFISPALQDVYVAANTSLIRSKIQLGDNAGVQTNNDRPLQGQSPWVVNVQLGYDDPETGIHAAILYNASGRRIFEVGTFGLPDFYDAPFHQLDAVLGVTLPKGFNIQASGRNLLDSYQYQQLGDIEVQRQRPGWQVGLKVGWSL